MNRKNISMHSISKKILLLLLVIVLINPSSFQAATEQRIALVIGNSTYSSGPLRNPVNDATDMAAALQKLGFKVNLKKNASLETMEGAIEDFGNRLKRGGVGLFYYAGHGVQVNGVNYLIPVNAKINKESDVRYKAVDAGRILDEMANANNGLNIVILDACRDNPFGKSFRSASRGLAIVSNSPSGTFISYSTSPGQVARDGEGRNSPYTKALLENITKPGQTINSVFMKVRNKVKKETGQVPWELTSLEGDFFFVPGSGKILADKPDSKPSNKDVIDDESRKLEEEELKLEKEKILLERKKALEEKRQKIEEEKAALEVKKLAMVTRPSVTTAKEIKRDGRFIAYDNGTVLDTNTNLMWAARDNGYNANWYDAERYYLNYRGGGYTDWRMPTQDELVGLYDTNKSYNTPCGYNAHLTELIVLTCTGVWAVETSGPNAAEFGFSGGRRSWDPKNAGDGRALPVRSAK
ncbi:MAG: caspase family protein [Smithellaceae bacterium]